MKIGVMSAAFPNMTLEELAAWAAGEGFQMLELACWPTGEGKDRRYGGVAHIDVDSLSDARVDEIHGLLEEHGLAISSLGYYPNPLHPEADHREHVIEHLKKVIVAAEKLGVGVVGSFVGRDWHQDLDANFKLFEEIWPAIVKFAGDHGVKIAIENCPMLYPDTWPGGTNMAISPVVWERMFDIIPDDHFGLNLDPSHLIWQAIDYVECVYDFAPRIFHVHAKDMQVVEADLARHGILDFGWYVPRLPGLGDVDWQAFISALYAVGYDFVISIEHEDPNWEETEELVKRGFLLAKKYLDPFIV